MTTVIPRVPYPRAPKHDMPSRPVPTVRGYPRGWTRIGMQNHRARVARHLAALACLTEARRDVDELRADLDQARAECAALRAQAGAGRELAAVVQRTRELEALLLADEETSEAPTGALNMRPRAVS